VILAQTNQKKQTMRAQKVNWSAARGAQREQGNKKKKIKTKQQLSMKKNEIWVAGGKIAKNRKSERGATLRRFLSAMGKGAQVQATKEIITRSNPGMKRMGTPNYRRLWEAPRRWG